MEGAKIAVKGILLIPSNTTISKIKAGDIDSFRELFDQWKGPIHNFVAKMTGSRSDAEDITQEYS
jgi:DNA-directed RNA polymerase specialized sigma24 family protein